MTDINKLYTIQEFSEIIRVHPNTIRRAINKGRIQAFRVGVGDRSSWRIPDTEVVRLCELDMTKLIERIVEEKMEERK